jgi:hypothetical protein
VAPPGIGTPPELAVGLPGAAVGPPGAAVTPGGSGVTVGNPGTAGVTVGNPAMAVSVGGDTGVTVPGGGRPAAVVGVTKGVSAGSAVGLAVEAGVGVPGPGGRVTNSASSPTSSKAATPPRIHGRGEAPNGDRPAAGSSSLPTEGSSSGTYARVAGSAAGGR